MPRGRPKGSTNRRSARYTKEQLKDGSWKKNRSFTEIPCSICGRDTVADANAISVICSTCVQKRVPVDPKLLVSRSAAQKDPNSVKPRGWRFMKEFVDADGTVYHAGVEMPGLKGTLPPMDIVAMKVKQKQKSREKKAKKAERAEKKQAKLAKEFEKKKKMKEREEKKAESEKRKEKFLGEE